MIQKWIIAVGIKERRGLREEGKEIETDIKAMDNGNVMRKWVREKVKPNERQRV